MWVKSNEPIGPVIWAPVPKIQILSLCAILFPNINFSSIFGLALMTEITKSFILNCSTNTIRSQTEKNKENIIDKNIFFKFRTKGRPALEIHLFVYVFLQHIEAFFGLFWRDCSWHGFSGRCLRGRGLPGSGLLVRGVPGRGLTRRGLPGRGLLGRGQPGQGQL